MIINTKELIEEKNELIIRLDKNHYKTLEEKEYDEKRLGEIEIEIKEKITNQLRKAKVEIAKKTEKVTTLKEAKKLFKQKYQDYREVTIAARNFVDSCVDKKKQGREIEEQFREGKLSDKKFISEVLRY